MTRPVNKKEHEIKPEKDLKGEKKSSGLATNLLVTSIICAIFVGANYFLQAKLLKTQLKTVTAGEENLDDPSMMDKPEKGLILDLGDFTMNLNDVTQRRYLKINVAIEVTTPNDPDGKKSKPSGGGHGAEVKNPLLVEMEQYKPAIRDAIITVMTSKSAEELSTTAGKELAKQQISDSVNDIFGGERDVIRVSFGDFIMQ